MTEIKYVQVSGDGERKDPNDFRDDEKFIGERLVDVTPPKDKKPNGGGSGDGPNGGDRKPRTTSLDAIRDKTFEPVRWAIRGVFPEGVCVLAGRPKMCKTWMAQQASVAKARGTVMWQGHAPETQCSVLYLALEDNERRWKKRSEMLCPDGEVDIDIAFEWPAWSDDPEQSGGEAVIALAEYFEEHPQCKFAVIDTAFAFRGGSRGSRDIAAADYAVGQALGKLAHRFGICIVVIMHTRKAPDESDPFAEIMGTTGTTAAFDTIVALRRKRNSSKALMYLAGRDIEDDRAINLEWDKDNTLWHWRGREETEDLTEESKEVLDVLGSKRMWPKQVYDAMRDKDPDCKVTLDAIKKRMRRMEERGELVWTKNGYGERNQWGHFAMPRTGAGQETGG